MQTNQESTEMWRRLTAESTTRQLRQKNQRRDPPQVISAEEANYMRTTVTPFATECYFDTGIIGHGAI